MKRTTWYIVLFFLLGIFIVLSMILGSVIVSSSEIFDFNSPIFNLRISRTLTAVISGAGIGVSGLLLQTIFKNPLAGPSILGVSSGATLGIALGVSLSPFISIVNSHIGLSLMAILGAIVVVIILITVSRYVGNSNTLLIVGLMLSYFTSALVNVLTFYMNKESIQGLVFWGFGSFNKIVDLTYFSIYILLLMGLILVTYFFIKKMDVLLLGESYAKAMGIKTKKVQFSLILIAGLIIGMITAWCGPIAFLGVAVPHLARNLLSSSKHFHVLNFTLLIGALLAIICDIIARLPGIDQTIPLNAVTSLIGAPIVIWIIFKYKLI